MYQKDHRVRDEPVGRFMAERSTQETWVIFGRFGEMANVKTALKKINMCPYKWLRVQPLYLELLPEQLKQEWILLGQLRILQELQPPCSNFKQIFFSFNLGIGAV